MNETYNLGQTVWLAESSDVKEGEIVYLHDPQPKAPDTKLAIVVKRGSGIECWPPAFSSAVICTTAAAAWQHVVSERMKVAKQAMEAATHASERAMGKKAS